MREYTLDVTYKGLVLTVSFDYEPEDKGVWTYSNGDPGYPGSPEELIINKVELDDTDITELVEDQLVEIEEALESQWKNVGRDDY